MRAILLCAGFATRLYPLTKNFPKALLEVGGRPIVEHLVECIARSGRIDSVTVVSNARFYGKFFAWAEGAAARHGLPIDVLDDGAWDAAHRLGAVSDLEFALARALVAGPVLVAAGDNLFRFSLDALLDDYEREPRNLVLVHREADPERLRRTGVVELGPDGRVTSLTEKPREPRSQWVCPPLYVFRPGLLERVRTFVTEAHDTDSPGHFIAWLAERGEVFAHVMQGERLDVGNLDSYRAADAWLARVERERPEDG